jgi:23S rRNA pseudouridine1911/1915/1917 synthase
MPTVLEKLLATYPRAKRQTLRDMVRHARVTLNGQPVKSLKQPVGEADRLEVARRTRPPGPSVEPLRLVHEDEDVVVVEKPAGLPTSTVPRERRPTALAILRRYLGPRARVGVIHRLDQDASGLLVFSKNSAAYDHLKRQFGARGVRRVYSAIVLGTPQPPADTIRNLLVEHADGTVHVTTHALHGRPAVTHYRVLRSVAGRSLLRVELETGRKHQIRAHLAHRGHPVVGDRVYSTCRKTIRLMLAATELAFTHPRTGRRVEFSIEAPEEFARIMRLPPEGGEGAKP